MLLIFAQKLGFWLMFLNLKECNLAKGDVLLKEMFYSSTFVKHVDM